MLKLDEKKIRNGRPIGLPYQGSKKKISKKIVEIIKQNFGTDKHVYDIFGGGGAITAECILNGLDVHYNDLDHAITDMFQRVLSTDREFLKTLIVSRDEFFKIREKENKTTDDELKLLVNSFGNDRKNYLYSKEFSDIKYSLSVEIIKNHDVINGYKQTDTYIKKLQKIKEQSELIKQLKQLVQLGRIQQLLRLQQLKHEQQLGKMEVTNLDYEFFSGVKNSILYLDPPYENTRLDSYLINKFDSQIFYDWAYEMSKKNIVLISSYEISDDRFECVYEFKKARSTFAQNKTGSRTEKLFMVKK